MDRWSRASGANVLPNLDRDDPAGKAPDNWAGGVWAGTYAPNNVIDNAADLRDVGRVGLAKLGDSLPAGTEVVLTLSAPAAEHPSNHAPEFVATKSRSRFPDTVPGGHLRERAAGGVCVDGRADPGLRPDQ